MKMSAKCLWVALVAAGVSRPGTLVGQGASVESIFDRPAPAAAPAPSSSEGELGALQLSGISTLGGQSMFNFVDARGTNSFWVALHGTTNGFSVTSYDENSDTVTVTHGGQQRQVRLRQVKIGALPMTAAAPPGVQLPSRPAGGMASAVIRTADGGEIVNPKTPQEIAQAETEARMMVSDLLEISMQERARQKALREAQQKQASGMPAGTPANPPR